MALQFWNTLKRKKEEFRPLQPNRVGLYTCGPTVYDFAHIGNLRAYIFEDILRRYLEYCGYAVNHIMNITDIDDKTIKRSIEENVSLTEYTRRYEKAFFEDRDILRIKPATLYPRATEHILEMVEIIKKLTEKGYTYQKDGSIYFSIERFPGYGKLSGIDLSSLKKGARIESDEYEKEDVRDFVLWKKSKIGEPSYDTEIGPGRPGWHIECSAMSMKYLGKTFDIHTGGVDNIFPHHENEIAQSEAANGKPFACYFLHCAHLLVNNEKMAKSKGNFFTLRDLLDKGYDPVSIRYLLLSVHYRSPLNFTLEGLEAAKNAVERIQNFYRRLRLIPGGITGVSPVTENVDQAITKRIIQAEKEFKEGLDDDLNMPVSLASLHNLITDFNPKLEKDAINETESNLISNYIKEIDDVLTILREEKMELTAEEETLISERETARKKKDFAKADAIRKDLEGRGIIVEDTPAGPRITRKQKHACLAD
ncbi:MAG: cysteine--tRNA ligase [Candidatus Omnitrophota bacterium]|nr:cysteine--tRNA ligase [Candidatus Omnitrophota bacterium]